MNQRGCSCWFPLRMVSAVVCPCTFCRQLSSWFIWSEVTTFGSHVAVRTRLYMIGCLTCRLAHKLMSCTLVLLKEALRRSPAVIRAESAATPTSEAQSVPVAR